jgi:DNA-directed RNA polymerase subunit alpha
MEQVATADRSTHLEKEVWSFDDYREILGAFAASNSPKKLLSKLTAHEAENAGAKGAAAVKLGIVRCLMGRYSAAMKALAEGTDNKDRRYFQAICHKGLAQYGEALDELERARARGFDDREIDFQCAEVLAMAGSGQKASAVLAKLVGKGKENARSLYIRGLIDELAGNIEQAHEAYHRAVDTDPTYAPAKFRLAYFCDLHGEEEEAVRLYKECLSHPPVLANALLNLAVLYEDMGQYEQAARCLERLLTIHPNHPRARLFLKDALAARTMFYDEDQAKRVARRNAVLDIPVTDFELSVRARNCLKKMNIRNLGDLVRTSEPELLGYKNFGETSLKEIKDMLSLKGLKLGQALEEDSASPTAPAEIPLLKMANDGVLATLISQIEMSIRARKALETLKITTLGQLTAKTEADLLACKNFGQTSLNEIRQRLTEYSLRLREPN